ncbi:hypothetical protein RvY_02494-2 [Ramazzottius varieornatus]|uniref:Uncharacterized protein n=1 Tax=Ramazzottius varieornatus TaxID=947166 RepID=A0A1D1UUF3_RAMVA|nr:hypothetical protein RvY_02494-2 [Ramazzottius varieornatus]
MQTCCTLRLPAFHLLRNRDTDFERWLVHTYQGFHRLELAADAESSPQPRCGCHGGSRRKQDMHSPRGITSVVRVVLSEPEYDYTSNILGKLELFHHQLSCRSPLNSLSSSDRSHLLQRPFRRT